MQATDYTQSLLFNALRQKLAMSLDAPPRAAHRQGSVNDGHTMGNSGFGEWLMHARSKPFAVAPGALIALAATLLILEVTLLVPEVQAQEFCVSCQGPETSYRCLIGGEGTPAARSSRGQFLCITELAKVGGHTTCSVSRNQSTPCPGETRTVMFSLADPETHPLGQAPAPAGSPAMPQAGFAPAPTGGVTQPGMTPTQTPEAPPARQHQPGYALGADPDAGADGYPTPLPPEEAAAAEQKKTAAEPSVVQDLANKTGKAFSDTGKAVGSAVKKSWDCVTSLFGKC